MVSPPPIGRRRAVIAAIWLLCAFTGLIGAVWAVGWALQGSAAPSLDTVAAATHLHYPDSTEVVEADLSEMHTPTAGSRGEVSVAVPADDFGDFISGNDMDAPLPSGTTPAGNPAGIIPAGCTLEVCYAAVFIVEGDTVTVDLDITLL